MSLDKEVKDMTKARTRMLFPSLLVLSCFLVLALAAIPCSATEVWSDNFDDGNLDGWFAGASATVVDGCLRGAGLPAEVHRPCNLSCGSWSLDVLDIGGWKEPYQPGLYVYFMGSDPDASLRTFYCLRITQGTTATGLKYIYAITKMDGSATTTLASGDGLERADLKGVLHHIRVTRSPDGHMSAYVNGTLMVEATDTEIASSESFRIIIGYDYAIDNIVVDDTPPLAVPLELLAVGCGIAVVIVVIAVIAKRR